MEESIVLPRSSPFDVKAIDSALHATLADALSTVPDGHTHVLLIDGRETADGASASIVYAHRQDLKDGKIRWDLATGITYDGKDIGVGVMTKVSW